MAITSNTISNFTLKTPCGLPISDRFCCKDDIVVSWNINKSDCSDFSGKMELKNLDNSFAQSFQLQPGTSDHKFCFCSCDSIAQYANYRLHFEGSCSDVSDVFDIYLTRFKTLVNAGSDQTILFGATAAIGTGSDDPHTVYCWSGGEASDFVSDKHVLHTLVRPCKPGCNKYEVIAHDSDFPECRAFDCVDITVKTPIITWSDAQQSDGGDTCTFSAWLISSDTYTKTFHIMLKDLATNSDIVNFYSDTPYFFTQTVHKPIVPGTTQYRLKAALSDFENCSHAIKDQTFFCTKAPAVLPAGPSTFEMLFRLFGFLILFILLGLALDSNL